MGAVAPQVTKEGIATRSFRATVVALPSKALHMHGADMRREARRLDLAAT